MQFNLISFLYCSFYIPVAIDLIVQHIRDLLNNITRHDPNSTGVIFTLTNRGNIIDNEIHYRPH